MEVVRIAQASGMVKLGTLAVDGTRLKANASKHKAMSYARMQAEEEKLRKEIERITELARRTDEAEDSEFGPDFRGDELPKELQRRKDRLATIRAAKKRLEEAQDEKDEQSGRGKKGRRVKREIGVPKDKAQSNFTDPESRVMKTATGGYEQCYNAQIAVDSGERIIVATDVTGCAADSTELLKMVGAAESNLGQQPKELLADAGYKSEGNFTALEERGVRAYVALGRGERLPEQVAQDKPATRRMARRLRTKQGRQRYRQRKAVVEPVFGWIKQALGFRTFLLRGVRKVQGEWNLVCLAMNLRRMATRLAW